MQQTLSVKYEHRAVICTWSSGSIFHIRAAVQPEQSCWSRVLALCREAHAVTITHGHQQLKRESVIKIYQYGIHYLYLSYFWSDTVDPYYTQYILVIICCIKYIIPHWVMHLLLIYETGNVLLIFILNECLFMQVIYCCPRSVQATMTQGNSMNEQLEWVRSEIRLDSHQPGLKSRRVE